MIQTGNRLKTREMKSERGSVRVRGSSENTAYWGGVQRPEDVAVAVVLEAISFSTMLRA